MAGRLLCKKTRPERRPGFMLENPALVYVRLAEVWSFAKIRFETLIKTEVKTGFKHIKHIIAVIYLYNCTCYIIVYSVSDLILIS